MFDELIKKATRAELMLAVAKDVLEDVLMELKEFNMKQETKMNMELEARAEEEKQLKEMTKETK